VGQPVEGPSGGHAKKDSTPLRFWKVAPSGGSRPPLRRVVNLFALRPPAGRGGPAGFERRSRSQSSMTPSSGRQPSVEARSFSQEVPGWGGCPRLAVCPRQGVWQCSTTSRCKAISPTVTRWCTVNVPFQDSWRVSPGVKILVRVKGRRLPAAQCMFWCNLPPSQSTASSPPWIQS